MANLTLDEAAKVLRVSTRSLSDRKFRVRIGLPARRIGKRLIFTEEDLLATLDRGRESFETTGGKANAPR